MTRSSMPRSAESLRMSPARSTAERQASRRLPPQRRDAGTSRLIIRIHLGCSQGRFFFINGKVYCMGPVVYPDEDDRILTYIKQRGTVSTWYGWTEDFDIVAEQAKNL